MSADCASDQSSPYANWCLLQREPKSRKQSSGHVLGIFDMKRADATAHAIHPEVLLRLLKMQQLACTQEFTCTCRDAMPCPTYHPLQRAAIEHLDVGRRLPILTDKLNGCIYGAGRKGLFKHVGSSCARLQQKVRLGCYPSRSQRGSPCKQQQQQRC